MVQDKLEDTMYLQIQAKTFLFFLKYGNILQRQKGDLLITEVERASREKTFQIIL